MKFGKEIVKVYKYILEFIGTDFLENVPTLPYTVKRSWYISTFQDIT